MDSILHKKIILLLNFRLLLIHDVLLQDQFTFHLLPTISHGSIRPEQAKPEQHKFGTNIENAINTDSVHPLISTA